MFKTEYHNIFNSELFAASVISSEYDSSYSTHDYSPSPAISLPINSCFNYKAGTNHYTLNSSTILIEKEDTEYLVSKFDEFKKDITLSIHLFTEAEEIIKLIRRLPAKTALTHSSPALDFLARALLTKTDDVKKEQIILDFINNISVSVDVGIEQMKINKLVYRQMNQAIEYIHTNYFKNIRIADIASAACMSIFHFSRIFKKVTKYSPYDYLIGVRVESAKKLITGGESITQTAFGVGFNSLENFSYRFKEITGASPLHFLKDRKVVMFN